MTTITRELESTIVNYMNDEIRERVHNEFAPCSPQKFIAEYCKQDESFIDLLYDEFSLVVDTERGQVY